MSEMDQETAAALAKIAADWRRLEAEAEPLRLEAETWRAELLAAADRLGIGAAIRRRGRETGTDGDGLKRPDGLKPSGR